MIRQCRWTNDQTGHFSYSNLPFEEDRYDSPLPVDQLKKRAIEYLELVVGNVHEKYVIEDLDDADPNADQVLEELEDLVDELIDELEEEEHEMAEDYPEEDWDDDMPEPEPTIMFTFYREHKGLRLESYEAHVHVGEFTGIIRECSVTHLTKEQFQSLENLNTTPTLSLKEAEERFFEEVEMKLGRAVKSLAEPETYTLTYLVDFPETGGHMQKINAHTGEVTYIDTGILKESE
ncbi:hypothetical protein F9U64_06135 [Gracilibacillus oryzae]|uniref:PepSY domain-containing protein n=1 Tax=Gracilibacillus oryzae TaxID=1672701 RepID=A0A7C8GUR8_9BACI|nr:PepSY domain-containing protein [Gracilibacillus oryzae]KAB8138205.1 hypothetical protein F9U64_06135 [Gracilibacillus oryzae]